MYLVYEKSVFFLSSLLREINPNYYDASKIVILALQKLRYLSMPGEYAIPRE